MQRFRSHADEISLVLLDMMMPVMGGEEALEEIRAIRPRRPVIASSGYSESVAKERFGGKGLAAFLQKPYSGAHPGRPREAGARTAGHDPRRGPGVGASEKKYGSA